MFVRNLTDGGTSDAGPVTPWDWRAVVGNRNSRPYHSPACKGGAKIAEKNRVVFASVAKAEAMGYRRAGDCR